jgi:hypothetical protein
MSRELPPTGRDPAAAAKLQILATEHWSLLATRALTYNESLSRVTIFLSILSGAIIALALVAQVSRFGTAFIAIAIPLLALVAFTGVSTIGRLMQLNGDDYRWVIGMNRLRRAYLDLYPELEPYFITGSSDDLPGALQTIGYRVGTVRKVGSVLHALQVLPGMLSVIVAAVVGAIGALVALAFGVASLIVVLAAGAAFLIAMVWLTMWGRRGLRRPDPLLEPRFPSPPLKK